LFILWGKFLFSKQ
jgi:protein phosphatase 2C family protein 2/3